MIPSDRSKTILAQHVSWPVDRSGRGEKVNFNFKRIYFVFVFVFVFVFMVRSGRGEKVNPDFQKNLVVCTVATTIGRAIGLIMIKFMYKKFKI